MAGFSKPIASNLLEYTEKQLKRLTSKSEKLRESGEVDAVHDLRVASRRLVAPLRIMADYIGDKRVREVVRDLRKLRGAFRDTRDLDVVQISLVGPGPTPLEPTALARLEGFLTRKREQSIRRARRQADRVDVDCLESSIRSIVRLFEESLEDLPEQNIHTLAQHAVTKWSARLSDRDPRSPETVHLHETRLCVKRLRYAAELLRDLEDRDSDPLTVALAEVQELLGQWNDHLVASCMISKLAGKTCGRGEDPGWAASLLSYAAGRAQAAATLRERIVQAWPAVTSAQTAAPRDTMEEPTTTSVQA